MIALPTLSPGRTSVIAALLAAFLAAACRESTSPRHAVSPIAGTFDFTTTLDSFTYFTYLDGSGLYHHATVPATAAALSGILTIEDSSIALSSNAAKLPVYLLTVQETPCLLTGIGDAARCDASMPSYVRDYASAADPISINADTLDRPVFVFSGGVSIGGEESIGLLTGRVFADSIVGTLDWGTRLGPAGDYYFGKYVARRRP